MEWEWGLALLAASFTHSVLNPAWGISCHINNEFRGTTEWKAPHAPPARSRLGAVAQGQGTGPRAGDAALTVSNGQTLSHFGPYNGEGT